jgi:hypothetical protein
LARDTLRRTYGAALHLRNHGTKRLMPAD